MAASFREAFEMVSSLRDDCTWMYDAEDSDLEALYESLRQVRNLIGEELAERVGNADDIEPEEGYTHHNGTGGHWVNAWLWIPDEERDEEV